MIHLVDLDHAGELDAFVLNHEHCHFMQTSLWGRVKRDWGWYGLISRNEDGSIRGTMALLRHDSKMLHTCFLYAPRGPIYEHSDAAAFRELIEGAKRLAGKLKAYRLRIDPMVCSDDRQFEGISTDMGFVKDDSGDFSLFQPRMCYVLPLKGQTRETLLAGYRQSTRRNVRLAHRHGITVQIGTEEDLSDFCCMMDGVGEKNHFEPRDICYFKNFLRGMGEHAVLYLARKDGRSIGGAVCVYFGKRAWYMYGCSDYTLGNTHGNTLLQYQMQCDAIDRGCECFDFRGVEGEPDPDNPKFGLHRFKQGFGARFVSYIGQLDLSLRPAQCRFFNLIERIKNTARY